MTPELYGTVVILVVLVMLSAFFSASETAFTSANRVKLKTMAQGGNKRAQIALNLAEDYDRLLSTILVGNNVVNIGASSMATGLFLALLSGNQSAATTVSTIVMTIVVLIFGEISPKAIAKENPETVAVAFAPVLLVLRTIVTPINALFVQWKKLLAKLFKPAHTESFVEAEIMTMVDEAQNDGDIDEHEGELIRSVIEFNDDRWRTPRRWKKPRISCAKRGIPASRSTTRTWITSSASSMKRIFMPVSMRAWIASWTL